MNKRGADLMFPIIGFTLLLATFTVLIIVTFVPKFTPECTFPNELDCVKYELQNSTSASIVLYLKNNFQENATITHIDVIDGKCSYSLQASENGTITWIKDDIMRITFDCKELIPLDNHIRISLEVQPNSDYIAQRYMGQVKYS